MYQTTWPATALRALMAAHVPLNGFTEKGVNYIAADQGKLHLTQAPLRDPRWIDERDPIKVTTLCLDTTTASDIKRVPTGTSPQSAFRQRMCGTCWDIASNM